MDKGMGWRPDVPDIRDLTFDDPSFMKARLQAEGPTLEARARLPEKVLLKNLPEVFDQQTIGSCVANGLSLAFAYARKVKVRSRLFIYYEARRYINETHVDGGCYIRDGIKVLAKLGAPREELWPYDVKKVFVDPPLNVDRSAKQFKIVKYARLENGDDYRRCLAEGYPFVIGFAVYDGFTNGRGVDTEIQLLPEPGQKMTGGHAVAVIGYDNNFRASNWAKDNIARGFPADRVPERVYIVRNSWGKGWGRNGDFAIDARYFENRNLADDAWTIRNA